MKIIQLTPGTGNFICGSCVRDNALVLALRRMGHDVLMVPLYLPHVLDEEDAGGSTPVFFGGVNVYLQQKTSIFRHTPGWLDHMFDRPGLLRWAANHATMTTAHDLGEMTVSMLQGEHGLQNKELSKLIAFLAAKGKPDVVCLSNAMLIGMAKRIRTELGCAVVCTLAGEDGFLDSIVEPHRTRAWDELKRRTGDVDAFIPVSHYYADVMRRRMDLPASKVHVVHNGIDITGYAPTASPPTTPTIGFLARLCETKGLGAIVDTFIHLKRRADYSSIKLILAGSMTRVDEEHLAHHRSQLKTAGVMSDVEIMPNITLAQKKAMLQRISVLCVPAMYGEAFGLYLLEAWASGVPVVQPRHAAFVELVEQTGGGILTDPDTHALDEGLRRLLQRPEEGRALGERGRQAVLNKFTVDHMAANVLNVFHKAMETPSDTAAAVGAPAISTTPALARSESHGL